jgi:hypothetical protein
LHYGEQNTYMPEDAKDPFVHAVAASPPWPLMRPGLQQRSGRTPRRPAEQVLAFDADHGSIEQLYHGLRGPSRRTGSCR